MRKPFLRTAIFGIILLCGSIQVKAGIKSVWKPDLSYPGVAWDIKNSNPSMHFTNGTVLYHFITSGTFGITNENYKLAIFNALTTWEDCTNSMLRFTRGNNISTDSDATNDAVNGFSFGLTDSSGNTQYGGNISGNTTGQASWDWVAGNIPYRITDADIAFAVGTNSTVSFSTDGGTNTTDFESTSLHEIGHSIGLAHSVCAHSEMSYMGGWPGTPGNTAGRRATEDDKLCIASLYPVESFTNQTGNITGTILLNGTNVHMAQLGLFDTNDILVSATVSRLGLYRFENVPAGNYTMRAFETFSSGDSLHQSYWDISSYITASTAQTPFLATSNNDVAVTVTAGTIVTQNMNVADGTCAMKLTYSIYKTGGTNRSKTQVLRMKKGMSTNIGIAGNTNMPDNVGEVAELSILSSGISMSNMTFTGTNVWPLNYKSIRFDVSIGTNATLGSHALVLRNTRFPGQRYMLFGFIEVYDETTVSAGLGPNNPAASFIGTAGAVKTMAQIKVNSGSVDDTRLRRINVTHIGTGSATNVNNVLVFFDKNGNGMLDPGTDKIAGSNKYVNGLATVNMAETVKRGQTNMFLIACEFTNTVSGGETYACAITSGAVNVWGVDSSTQLTPSGLPVTGSVVTVDSTPPVAGIVNDGSGVDTDMLTSLNTIVANWGGFNDANSGIAYYEWAIGTNSGGAQVQAFANVGLATIASNSSLNLSLSGRVYYVSVRAYDAAGNVSTNAVSNGISGDSDGDGMPDATELLIGTDPVNPKSVFKFNSLMTTNSSDMALCLPTISGRIYSVYWKTNLMSTNWFQLVTNILGDGNILTLQDTNNSSSRFYKSTLK